MNERPQSRPFEHVHAPRAELYRRIMRTFAEAKHRFLVHLRPEDVREALAPSVSTFGEADRGLKTPGRRA